MKRNADEIFTKLQCQFFYALSSEPQVTVGERERKREKCKQFRTIFYVNKTERWSRGETCAKENIHTAFFNRRCRPRDPKIKIDITQWNNGTRFRINIKLHHCDQSQTKSLIFIFFFIIFHFCSRKLSRWFCHHTIYLRENDCSPM